MVRRIAGLLIALSAAWSAPALAEEVTIQDPVRGVMCETQKQAEQLIRIAQGSMEPDDVRYAVETLNSGYDKPVCVQQTVYYTTISVVQNLVVGTGDHMIYELTVVGVVDGPVTIFSGESIKRYAPAKKNTRSTPPKSQ